jgi:hydrogenase maturation protease
MEKNILLLCCGYPFKTDTGFGYHVAQVLDKMELPENVEFMEVGESACMIPGFLAGRDKLIVVDFFQTDDEPGTVVRLKMEEVPLTVNGVTDIPKLKLIQNLEDCLISGDCPEAVFIGVVPKDVKSSHTELTPEIKSKIPQVIALILKEIKKTNSH